MTIDLLRRGALALIALVALALPAAAQLSGSYRGVDEAEGMRLELRAAGGGYTGTFVDRTGAARPFSAEAVGGRAEAVVPFEGFNASLVVVPEPIGAQALVTPLDPSGRPLAEEMRALPFLRAGVSLPDSPDRYLPPPGGPVPAMDARGFASSYPFWPPLAAAYGWEGVAPRYRTVIRLFPLVQTDLLWKLCQSPERLGGLGEALRGQNVTCQEVLSAFDAMRRGGGFERFKADVARERRTLLATLDCATDYTSTRAACDAAGAETARRALSMETAATTLARYR